MLPRLATVPSTPNRITANTFGSRACPLLPWFSSSPCAPPKHVPLHASAANLQNLTPLAQPINTSLLLPFSTTQAWRASHPLRQVPLEHQGGQGTSSQCKRRRCRCRCLYCRCRCAALRVCALPLPLLCCCRPMLPCRCWYHYGAADVGHRWDYLRLTLFVNAGGPTFAHVCHTEVQICPPLFVFCAQVLQAEKLGGSYVWRVEGVKPNEVRGRMAKGSACVGQLLE